MYQDLKEFAQSRLFQRILMGISAVVLTLLIFQAGMFVGYRKAAFTYRFGDNYYRAFGNAGPGERFFASRGGPFPGGLIEGHGVAGKIVSINLPTFVVTGPDDIEKVILIGDGTRIRRFDTTLSSSDLKVDDFTVILGSPNDNSQIEAKLILPLNHTRLLTIVFY